MVKLSKGQKVELTKGSTLKSVHVGLGWNTNKYQGNAEFDLDVSVFLLGGNGKVVSDNDLVFYNSLVGGNGSVEHTGDNRTGSDAVDADDEVVYINLNDVPEMYQSINIVVTIDDATQRAQTFGQVSNAFIRIVDRDTNAEVLRFDLGEEFSIETSLLAGRLYRHDGNWKFDAVGAGYQGGLKDFCDEYGVDAG